MPALSAIAFGLLLASAGAAKDRPRHCMLRAFVQANPQDTETFATSVPAQVSGKDVAIEKIPRISEHDVIGYYPYKAQDGSYGVLLQLDEHGRIMLDTLSVERRGSLLFVFVNGRLLTALEIDKRVSDGKLYIASGLTVADIDSMKRDWRLIGPKRKR